MARLRIGEWTYVTEAWEAQALPAAWREELVALGFRPVGVVERRLPPLAAGQGLPVVDVPRWEQEARERFGVMAGPANRAFAVVEAYFEEELLSLRTLTAAGEVVETTVAPVRETALPPETLTATIFSGRGLRRWGRRLSRRGQEEPAGEPGEGGGHGWLARLAGEEATWIRQARPGAGYHLELVQPGAGTEAETAEMVWERHRERLAALAPETAIPPHDDLALYLALLLQRETVADAFNQRLEQWNRRSSYAFVLLALLAAVVLPLSILIWGGLGAVPLSPVTWLGVGLLVLMGLLFLAQPLLRRVAIRQAARELGRVPADELLRRVRSGQP